LPNGPRSLLTAATSALSRIGHPGPGPARVDTAALRKILVVRADDRVGNVLLTTPLLRALREGLPHVRIDWLIAARRRVLVDRLYLAHTLVPYDKRRCARNPAALAALLWRLRRERYDAVVEASHHDVFSLTQALFARVTAAPVRVSYDRGESRHYYTHALPSPSSHTYDVAARLGLLEPLGLPPRGVGLETSAGTGPEAMAAAEALLRVLRLEPGRFVVANPGARKLDRRFPPERLAEVLRRVAKASGLKVLVVWGPGEEALAQEAVEGARPAAVLAPATDLHLLAALLRRAALLVTNDTGPMHLGVACGTPVLALFTQQDAARWGHPQASFRAVDASEQAADVPAAAERAAAELVDVARA
jgi:ADP-heptose:LPS heptosyltransferase